MDKEDLPCRNIVRLVGLTFRVMMVEIADCPQLHLEGNTWTETEGRKGFMNKGLNGILDQRLADNLDHHHPD